MVKKINVPYVDPIVDDIMPWAVRYAITRQTYANSTVAAALAKALNNDSLTRASILCIQRDICEALGNNTIPAEFVGSWRDYILPLIRKKTKSPLVIIGARSQIELWRKKKKLTKQEIKIATRIEDIVGYAFPEVVGVGDFYRREKLYDLYQAAKSRSFAVRWEGLTEVEK